jgi:hypothetical protein
MSWPVDCILCFQETFCTIHKVCTMIPPLALMCKRCKALGSAGLAASLLRNLTEIIRREKGNCHNAIIFQPRAQFRASYMPKSSKSRDTNKRSQLFFNINFISWDISTPFPSILLQLTTLLKLLNFVMCQLLLQRPGISLQLLRKVNGFISTS